MAKAVFLDRDDTLNPDSGYINDPKLFMLYPWVAQELKRLKERGFLLILVTNQSGVGRGLIPLTALIQIHEKLNALLKAQAGIEIDHFEVCPHKPEDQCECRKPKPMMILRAAEQFHIDLSESFMIGDRSSDYEMGVNAGVKACFKIKANDEISFHQAIEEILALDS